MEPHSCVRVKILSGYEDYVLRTVSGFITTLKIISKMFKICLNQSQAVVWIDNAMKEVNSTSNQLVSQKGDGL